KRVSVCRPEWSSPQDQVLALNTEEFPPVWGVSSRVGPNREHPSWLPAQAPAGCGLAELVPTEASAPALQWGIGTVGLARRSGPSQRQLPRRRWMSSP